MQKTYDLSRIFRKMDKLFVFLNRETKDLLEGFLLLRFMLMFLEEQGFSMTVVEEHELRIEFRRLACTRDVV